LKYVKGTGLQNKVFEYLTFKSGNLGKMSRESQWNGCDDDDDQEEDNDIDDDDQ